MYDVIVKSSCSLSHLLMSFLLSIYYHAASLQGGLSYDRNVCPSCLSNAWI